MSDIYLSLTETPTVVSLSNPVIAGGLADSVTVTNVVSVNVVTMPTINVTAAVSGGLTNAELRASAVSVAVTTMPALSISSVTISNFPAAQVVTGTVALDAASLAALESVTVTVGNVTIGSAVTISGFSTSSLPPSTVTVGNSLTISTLPAISGTVTANVSNITLDGDGNLLVSLQPGNSPYTQPISGTVTANVGGIASGVTIPVRLFAEQTGGPSSGQDTLIVCDSGGQLLVNALAGGQSVLGYDGNPFVTVKQVAGSSVTIGNTVTVAGTVTANINGTVPVSISSVTIGNFPSTQTIAGTVTANASNGTLTTRFGTPTTASVAFATSAVTNANRKYLLIQNVTTGSNVITVGIGFTPTTTQGIQLTAGAGITFESSYIPTGAVQILSSVTASNFTILEA